MEGGLLPAQMIKSTSQGAPSLSPNSANDLTLLQSHIMVANVPAKSKHAYIKLSVASVNLSQVLGTRQTARPLSKNSLRDRKSLI
mgnify:CR=1 FL=1